MLYARNDVFMSLRAVFFWVWGMGLMGLMGNLGGMGLMGDEITKFSSEKK